MLSLLASHLICGHMPTHQDGFRFMLLLSWVGLRSHFAFQNHFHVAREMCYLTYTVSSFLCSQEAHSHVTVLEPHFFGMIQCELELHLKLNHVGRLLWVFPVSSAPS